MPTLRLIALIGAGLMILARPWYGDLGLALYYLGPLLFGLVYCFRRLPFPIWHEALLVAVWVGALGSLRVLYEGATERSFYFDGDSDLVWVGVGVQIVVAIVGFALAAVVRALGGKKKPELS